MQEIPPKLRDDLDMVPRQVPGGPLCFVLHDPKTAKTFEMAEEEHFLCRQLDGQTAPEEIRRRFEKEFDQTLSAEDLDAFLAQLRAEGFIEHVAARTKTLPEMFDADELLPYGQWRLTRGDRLIDKMARNLLWLYSRPIKVATVALVFAGLAILVRELGQMIAGVQLYWGLTFFVAVVLSGSLLVNAPRVLMQGVACKRYGGYVTEIGVVFFYYLIPRLYCQYADVSWLKEKSRLMWALFSGIWFQLCIWSVATIGWFVTAPGTLPNGLWLALSLGAGAGLLLLVLNPLVKMDGYHMLVTWFDSPRLRERALAAFGSSYGSDPWPEPLETRHKVGLVLFGAGIFLFTNVALLVFLFLAGRSLVDALEGPGFLLAVALGLFLFQRTISSYLKTPFTWVRDRIKAARSRWGWRFWLCLLLLLLLFLPYPYETGGQFTVLPGLRSEVHCEIDGGPIVEIFVEEGEQVVAGQPLAQINQREYTKNLEVTLASLDETRANLRYMEKQSALLDNPPDVQLIRALEAEERKLQRLETDFREELELTTLRSAIDGIVITPNVEQMKGKYLRKGDLFAIVEQQETVKIEILVPEADAPRVELGARVKVAPWAYADDTFYGTVLRIAPIANTPIYPPKISPETSVRVIAELPNADYRFKSQITGFAKIKTEWRPVWWVFSHLIVRWVKVQVWYWIP